MANSNEVVQAENEASPSSVAPAENNSSDQQQPQQQQQESPWKGILFRIFLFWFISNLFRGRQQPTTEQGPSFKPATNLFKPMDYMVSSELYNAAIYSYFKSTLKVFFVEEYLLYSKCSFTIIICT